MQSALTWLAVLAPLCLTTPVLAQRAAGVVDHAQKPDRRGIEPDSERTAVFLTGGAWQRVRPRTASPRPPGDEATQPGQAPILAPPPWLEAWQRTLREGLQPARLRAGAPAHPLLRVEPHVLALDFAAPGTVATRPMAWSDLACPPAGTALPARGAGPVQLDLQVVVLQAADDGTHRLGLDLACRQPARGLLLRSLRLVAHTDGKGRVSRAAGVRVDRPLPLEPMPAPDATAAWPVQPAAVDAPFLPLLALGADGWAAQVHLPLRAGWSSASALPGAGPSQDPRAPLDTDEPLRALWWLDVRGEPKAALFQAQTPDQRRPFWREGVWDAAVPALGGTLLLQRAAVPLVEPEPGGGSHRTWREAGYAGWLLATDGTAREVPVALPRLPREGLWTCELAGDHTELDCHFGHGGAETVALPPDVRLKYTAGRGFVPIRGQKD